MFNGRLQPKGTALVVRVLLMWVGALGFAAGAALSFPRNRESTARVVLGNAAVDWNPALRQGQGKLFAGMTGVAAGQTRADTPPSSNKVKAQTLPLSPKLIHNQSPLRVSGERPRRASTRGWRRRRRPTTRTRIAQAAPAKPIKKPSPAPVSGQSSKEAPAGAAGAESPRTTALSLLSTAAGRRDPFKVPVTPGPGSHLGAGGVSGTMPAGLRGLVISELRLEGVVRQKAANTMIAVVTNYTKRAYFLRVSDTVYNGVVSKITPEAVYFKENTLDSLGREATQEVEIKLGSAPGEGR